MHPTDSAPVSDPLTCIPVCNPNKIHWFTKLGVSGVHTLVCGRFPGLCLVLEFVSSPQEKFCRTTHPNCPLKSGARARFGLGGEEPPWGGTE